MAGEIYFSTDIETDGPIPGPNSMLSFGCVALDEGGKELGAFSRNLELLPGAQGAPDTMTWWSQPEQQAAWEACRKDPVPPERAMRDYVAWVEGFRSRPVFVAYPAGFDFLFVYWYLVAFTGSSPFSFSALDIKSFAMAITGLSYRQCTKRNWPRRWMSAKGSHTHVALDDAREQGAMFMAMLAEARKLHALSQCDGSGRK